MIETLPWFWALALLAIIWVAAIHDLRTSTIPHGYVYAVLVLLGLVTIAALTSGFDPGKLPWLALGGGIALAGGFVLFLFNVMGAGDTKLLAAMAPMFSFSGLPQLFVYITVCGLVWTLAYALVRALLGIGKGEGVRASFAALRRLRVPYGPAIAAGTTLYVGLPWLGA